MAARTASTLDDAGLGEAGEVVAAAIDLDLEVAGAATDAQRELRGDAPAEVLERSSVRVPGREHGRAETLDVAVLVARDRADVVGGDDPAPAVADAAQDEHDAEARQLVVGEAGPAVDAAAEDLVERIGVDRRGQPVADARGPDRDARLGAPGVRRQVVGQLRDQEDRVVGADRRRARSRSDRATAAAASRARAPAAASRTSRSRRRAPRSARRAAGSRGARRAAWTCRLPAPAAATTSGTRPSMSTQSVAASSRIERAGADQLDDRARRRWDVADGPPAPRGRGLGHGRSVGPAPRSVKRRASAPNPGRTRPCDDPISRTGQPWQRRRPTIGPTARARHPSRSPPTRPRPRVALRAGRRPEVVLVRLLPGPRPSTSRAAARRGTARSWSGAVETAPRAARRARRLRRRRGRRLGQHRAARGLRAARALEGPRADRRQAGLVDRLLRRRPSVARPGRRRRAARRRRSTTPATTARRRSRPTRSRSPTGERDPVRGRLPGHALDVRAGRLQGRRAPPVPGRARFARSSGGAPAASGNGRPTPTSSVAVAHRRPSTLTRPARRP